MDLVPLEDIPYVCAHAPEPQRVGTVADAVWQAKRYWESRRARVALRKNLMYFKVRIVKAVTRVLLEQAPKGDILGSPGDFEYIELSRSEIQDVTNIVADWYICAVDEFMVKHPGARSAQGTRNIVLNYYGWQDVDNHPWCDDWATELLESAEERLWGESVTINGKKTNVCKIIEIERVQWHWLLYQHNYLAVKPTRYTIKDPPKSDTVITMYDAWINLLPEVYTPLSHPYPALNVGVWTPNSK